MNVTRYLAKLLRIFLILLITLKRKRNSTMKIFLLEKSVRLSAVNVIHVETIAQLVVRLTTKYCLRSKNVYLDSLHTSHGQTKQFL